jgi:hypothetical protein
MLEWVTLFIAVAGLVTSAAVAFETWRQGRNAVRPVLVVLEKLTDNRQPELGYSLYLVNMGQAVALNIDVARECLDVIREATGRALEEHPRREIAVERRGLLCKGYRERVYGRIRVRASYADVNGKRYRTSFETGTHTFPAG